MSNTVEQPPADESAQVVQEYVDSAGQALRADAGSGVLRGVKLLGLRSRNGRRYAETALRQAIGLYEGAKVNVNHPERDPLSPRDYRDRLGAVRNVRFEPNRGLFGDLHYNPKHALAEQLGWDAENAPENVGLSHNVLARTRRDAEGVVVESITRVQSVDLVADPATTAGLYEQTSPAVDDGGAVENAAGLREELDRLREQYTRLQRRLRIEELLREQRLEEPAREAVVTEAFLRRLLSADESDLEELIEERTRLARLRPGQLPESREQARRDSHEPIADTASFVEAISRRR